MRFLLSIEDVNQIFDIYDMFVRQFDLPKSEEVIYRAWRFYEIEGAVGEDFEFFPLKPNQYDDKNQSHRKEMDFSYLERNLNVHDFQDDVIQTLQKEKEKFLQKFDDELLSLQTEIQIEHSLNELLEDIERTVDSLNALSANKFQRILIAEHIKSYNEISVYLNNKYQKYIRVDENDELLRKYLQHNKISKVIQFENELIEMRFLQKSGDKLYWNSQKGYKVRLVNFCRLLEAKGYSNPNIKITSLIKFFEERYNFDVGDQAKPNKFNGTIPQITTDFYFLKW